MRGLEALLVVAAVVAYLVKSGNKRFTKWIYVGVLAGLAGAGVVAVIFVLAFGGSGPIQEIMEGVCALIAMAMLLWTSNWMLNKSSVEAWNRYIKGEDRSRGGLRLLTGRCRRKGRVPYGDLARHAELPRRVP